MSPDAETVWTAIASRRSIRRFAPTPIAGEVMHELVALACAAPAPHHSRPWRFVLVGSPGARERLIQAMAAAWRFDLERDAKSPASAQKLLARSRRQLTGAPVLLLACLSLADARAWPDRPRRSAERDMFVQSLGAALQNLLLAAHARGLAGYLKGAPLFCQPAVAAALDLPPDWEPAFLVLLGYPAEGHSAEPRPVVYAEDVLIER